MYIKLGNKNLKANFETGFLSRLHSSFLMLTHFKQNTAGPAETMQMMI